MVEVQEKGEAEEAEEPWKVHLSAEAIESLLQLQSHLLQAHRILPTGYASTSCEGHGGASELAETG